MTVKQKRDKLKELVNTYIKADGYEDFEIAYLLLSFAKDICLISNKEFFKFVNLAAHNECIY